VTEATGDARAEAVVDLLGMLGYGELLAFDRMATDARLAPDLHRRAVLSGMAAVEITNHRRLVARLVDLGADPEKAMAPFIEALHAYHDRTAPRDWLEALTKAYVGDGIADDFFREVAARLVERDRKLVLEVLHDSRYNEFAAAEIKAAIAADPRLANRLSMWARRLVGEGLCQAYRVAADRPALAVLLATGSGRGEPSRPAAAQGVQLLLKRLTQAHGARMAAVGLNN
jgi:hypothetical protein